MSKLDLIRAGHAEVADGQCGLCDTAWPCDTGVVLAALAAAEARAEQAERERDEAQSLLRDRSPLFQDYEDAKRDNARLSSRLATVEAALSRVEKSDRARMGAWSYCGACGGKSARTSAQQKHLTDCPFAALAATPAAGEVE